MNLDYLKICKIKFIDNKICLRDLITQTQNLKNSKEIIDFSKSKTYDDNGHSYVDLKTVVKIFEKFKNRYTEDILEKLKKQNNFDNLFSDLNYEIYMINFDTSCIVSILDTENLNEYDGYNVIYMIIIGIYKGGFLIKFGVTGDLAERFKQHKKTYKPQFTDEGLQSNIKLIYVAITDNNEVVEDAFKQLVKSKGLNVELEFEGKNKVELFVTNNVFTVEKAKYEMSMMVKTKKTKMEQKKDEYINKIENNYQNIQAIALIENEKTKQIEIECNRDIKVAEENRIAKQIELEIIKESKLVKSPKDLNDDTAIDIYLNFINECTEASITHIHYTTLYEAFKKWFTNNNLDNKVPTYMSFSKGMKPHTGDGKVRVNNIVLMGAKNRKLKNI
jgi:hypothetical protein